MNFVNFNDLPIEKVEKRGQTLIKLGKIFAMSGLVGLGLLLIMIIIGALFLVGGGIKGILFTLALGFYGAGSGIAYIVMILAYLGIFLGICAFPTYLCGLHLFAVGRIAVNTEKK